VSVGQNKESVRRDYEEIWNEGRLEVADETIAVDYVNHDPVSGDIFGIEAYKEFVSYFRTAMPDLHFTIEDMIAADNKVVVLFTVRGTQKGELMGIAPTNKQVTITGIGIERMIDGKSVETWGQWDALGLMKQLGAIPSEE
jgi:steroid delta-isomerase-like uncharacterized protein